MNKFILAFVVIALFTGTSTASAAMPNYVGSDYKQAADCISSFDHNIYDIVDGSPTVTGCITDTAWDRAQALSRTLQSGGYQFVAGSFVTLITGAVEQCPSWYGKMKCVIDSASIVR